MYRYSWGPRQATLDLLTSPPRQALSSSNGFPLAYRGAHQVSSWGRHVWCRRPKFSVSFREADGYAGAVDLFV